MNSNDNMQSPDSRNNRICKTVVLLGSSEVGKTNILQQYTKKRFDENYMETIGVDYFSKEVSLGNGNASLVLSIWDTCGSELEFKILPSNVYRVASAYIIVCSYDRRDSFDMLKNWIMHVQHYLNNNHRSFNNNNTPYLIPIIILINKADIKTNRKFKISDVIKLADEFTMNILVYETSAKDYSKLTNIFEKVAALVSGRMSLQNDTTVNTTAIDEDNQEDANNNLRRKKSFQLKVGKERNKNKNGSCCNKSG